MDDDIIDDWMSGFVPPDDTPAQGPSSRNEFPPQEPLFRPCPRREYIIEYIRDCGCDGKISLFVAAGSDRYGRKRAGDQFREMYRTLRTTCPNCNKS